MPVVGITNDHVYDSAVGQKAAGEPEADVVGVFIFAKRVFTLFAHRARVGAAVAGYDVIDPSFELIAFERYQFVFLSEDGETP